MTTWNNGNYFRDTVTLTEDSVINGGNWVLAEITTNGHALTLNGGNLRGLHIDTEKDPVSWPGNVTTNATLSPGHATYVWQHLEPLPLAADILADAETKGGTDGVEAWLWTVQFIFDNPTTTQIQWVAAYDVWVASSGNAIESTRLFVRLRDKYFPGKNFQEVRDDLLVYDYETWEGKATQVEEEYS